MNISDPIADLLTRIRNAAMAQHRTVDIPHSKMKVEIVRLLKSEGYIEDFSEEGEVPTKKIIVWLKYTMDQGPVIRGLKRVSKPGLRQYVNSAEIPRVLGGLGIAILSTSHGIMTDRQARKNRVGGEVLCNIW
ncbi:MAG: small subunit ribosomal protein S8 [Verrucomicrobiales bacterium]|jgi:small subunit ribosomal protein S8